MHMVLFISLNDYIILSIHLKEYIFSLFLELLVDAG